MIKVVNISETSPSEIIEHVNAHGILAIHGGRLEVRNALNQAKELANPENSNEYVFGLTLNHDKTELGHPHNPNIYTLEHAKNLAIPAFKRDDLKKIHPKVDIPPNTITSDQQDPLRKLVKQIESLEKMETVGNGEEPWEIWDQLSVYCDAIKTEGRARYKNIAMDNFDKGHSFLLTWLVQLLQNNIASLKRTSEFIGYSRNRTICHLITTFI